MCCRLGNMWVAFIARLLFQLARINVGLFLSFSLRHNFCIALKRISHELLLELL